MSSYDKKYYEEHKEKYNEYKRRWREKNKEEVNKKQREYMKEYLKNENNKNRTNDYKREWTRNKRKKDKENAELVIKQKEVLDKIKEYCIKETVDNREYRDVAYRDALNNILELLEEIK